MIRPQPDFQKAAINIPTKSPKISSVQKISAKQCKKGDAWRILRTIWSKSPSRLPSLPPKNLGPKVLQSALVAMTASSAEDGVKRMMQVCSKLHGTWSRRFQPGWEPSHQNLIFSMVYIYHSFSHRVLYHKWLDEEGALDCHLQGSPGEDEIRRCWGSAHFFGDSNCSQCMMHHDAQLFIFAWDSYIWMTYDDLNVMSLEWW